MYCCISTPTTDSNTSMGMIWVTLNMLSAANRQGNVRESSGNFTFSGEWSPWLLGLVCFWFFDKPSRVSLSCFVYPVVMSATRSIKCHVDRTLCIRYVVLCGQNVMTFDKCTINGRMYGDLFDEEGNSIDITEVSSVINIVLFSITGYLLTHTQLQTYSYGLSQHFLENRNTIRYYSVYLMCSKKLTGSQLSPPHGINKKIKMWN